MGRPKGSKNKKTTARNANLTFSTPEELESKITAAEAEISALTGSLKAKKAELKALTKAKAEAEKIAAQQKSEADKERILQAVAASGKSIDEIIDLLK